MDNNKFLGESGLNQLITNVHDVTFKEISYDDYMALPEEERNIGRYAVIDWPEDSNIKIGNIAYDITTLWEGDIGYNDNIEKVHEPIELNDSFKNYDVIAFYTGQYTTDSEKTYHTFSKWTYYITSELRIEPDILSIYSIDNAGGSQFRRIGFTFIDEKTIDLNYIQRMSIYKVIGLKFKMVTGSGGSSKHSYSTEEQIVGTWVNGKPIYERTFVFDEDEYIEALPNVWTHTSLYHSDYDIDLCLTGFAVGSSKRSSINCDVGALTDGTIGIQHHLGANLLVYTLTIQYTKTTD